jgi:N-acetylmuramoyl-L-alanine amidase
MTRRGLSRWAAFPFIAAALLSASGASATAADPKLPVSGPTPAIDAVPADPTLLEVTPTAANAVPTSVDSAPAPEEAEVECVAKVIIHEAGGEPRDGQVAVAQVIRRRMHDRRFGDSACGVIRQRGQFFNVDAYNPARDTVRWQNAVAIATDTLAGGGDELAPGALFFHAVRAGVPSNRVRVALIGRQLFYR